MALPIKIAKLGKTHVSVSNSWHHAGNAHFAMNRFDEALKCYQKSLDIRENVYADNDCKHPEIAVSLNALALVYDKTGDYSKAMDYFEKARIIQSGVDVPAQTPRGMSDEMEVPQGRKFHSKPGGLSAKKPLIAIPPKKSD